MSVPFYQRPLVRSLLSVAAVAGAACLPACADGDDPAEGGCLAEGPVGSEPGLVAPSVTLYDCTGAPVGLADLCPRTAAFVYTFAAW